MKSLVCVRPGKLEYFDTPSPALHEGHAIIRIRRVGICGTDLHAFEGTQPFFTYPRRLGHELAGDIIDTGDMEGFHKAETVSIIPYFHCGTCIACRQGKTNCCTQLQVCGVHIDGGMAEYLAVPAHALLHGQGLSYDELALVEPLAIGAHAVRRAGILENEFVLVVGAGPIGLGIMEFARISGGRVIVLDVNESRLAFCKEKLHVPYTINASSQDVTAVLKEITDGNMPTVVLDATGSQKAMNTSFHYLAHGARYVLAGLQKGEIIFGQPEFHKREATLMSSRNATREDFEWVISSIKKQSIHPLSFITHRVLFEQMQNEFIKWLNPVNKVIKAMVEFN